MPDKNCVEVTEGHELVVVRCVKCGFHLGVDLSYLEQVKGVNVSCPSCHTPLRVGEADDCDGKTKPKLPRVFNPYEATQREVIDLYMKYLGALNVLCQAHLELGALARGGNSDAYEEADTALKDAQEFLKGRIQFTWILDRVEMEPIVEEDPAPPGKDS